MKNVRVLQAEVRDIDVDTQAVVLDNDRIHYDHLVLATGATHHYFGHDAWAGSAPGLKTIEDATAIRAELLKAFEEAERDGDTAPLTFAIVGGGPTGVELAGAIGELAHHTLRRNFRAIDPAAARIILLEGADRLLLTYPENLSQRAAEALVGLGVEVRTQTMVTDIQKGSITVESNGETNTIDASVVLWAAGVKASPLGKCLGVELDRAGRVLVEPDLTVPGHPEVSVIGDLASLELPGTAPVAMQGRTLRSPCDPSTPRGQNTGAVPLSRQRQSRGHRARQSGGTFGAVRLLGPSRLSCGCSCTLMYLVVFENRVHRLSSMGVELLHPESARPPHHLAGACRRLLT